MNTPQETRPLGGSHTQAGQHAHQGSTGLCVGRPQGRQGHDLLPRQHQAEDRPRAGRRERVGHPHHQRVGRDQVLVAIVLVIVIALFIKGV